MGFWSILCHCHGAAAAATLLWRPPLWATCSKDSSPCPPSFTQASAEASCAHQALAKWNGLRGSDSITSREGRSLGDKLSKEPVGSQSKETQVFTCLSLTDSRVGIIYYPRHHTFSEDATVRRDGYCSEVAQSVQNLSSLHVAINITTWEMSRTSDCEVPGALEAALCQAVGDEWIRGCEQRDGHGVTVKGEVTGNGERQRHWGWV